MPYSKLAATEPNEKEMGTERGRGVGEMRKVGRGGGGGGGGGAFPKDEACRSDEGGLTRPQTTAIDQFLSTSSTGQATSWLPLPSGPLFV